MTFCGSKFSWPIERDGHFNFQKWYETSSESIFGRLGNVIRGVLIPISIVLLSRYAIRLPRKVEMSQWKEDKERKTHKKLGGTPVASPSFPFACPFELLGLLATFAP